MDENEYYDLGEMGKPGASNKSLNGELFYQEIVSPHEGPASHETVSAHFTTVPPTGYDIAEDLGISNENVTNQSEPIIATVVGAPHPGAPRTVVMPPQRPSGRLVPVVLFCLTCCTTMVAGMTTSGIGLKALGFLLIHGRLPHGIAASTITESLFMGFQYAGPLMLILLCHEMGHYLQARRNRIPASLPYFIPIPFGFLGTMGAVIGMRANLGDRRSLFDIGITGPLAGLVPTLIFLFAGLHLSHVAPIDPRAMNFGEPLIMKWVISHEFGTIPPGHEVYFHPMAFAAWVGLLITSLNLIPIGQLDGGHVLHALLPKASSIIARTLLFGAIFASFYFGYAAWALMIFLLLLMGPNHPPTADDRTPIGPLRTILGWATLAFIFIGFTPMPIKF